MGLWRKEEFIPHGPQTRTLCQWHSFCGRRRWLQHLMRWGCSSTRKTGTPFPSSVWWLVCSYQADHWTAQLCLAPGEAVSGSHHEMSTDGGDGGPLLAILPLFCSHPSAALLGHGRAACSSFSTWLFRITPPNTQQTPNYSEHREWDDTSVVCAMVYF